MEIDSGSSSSDEECLPNSTSASYAHSARVKISVGCADTAKTVAEVIKIDKEPSRSGARREVRNEGEYIVIDIESTDPKSLSKSISNAVEMIDLSTKTIKMCENYRKAKDNGLKRKLSQESQS
ncbi:unnamed protein product [Caenorhabditis brenneri]